MAECSFARDVLKSFLLPICGQLGNRLRDYVDDLVVLSTHTTNMAAALQLKEDSNTIKQWLTNNGMVVNAAKEQVWGSTVKIRRSLHSVGVDPKTVAAQVKDLGV